jgi:hypothetical protein
MQHSFRAAGLLRTARTASMNNSSRPSCILAEHSRYLYALIFFFIFLHSRGLIMSLLSNLRSPFVPATALAIIGVGPSSPLQPRPLCYFIYIFEWPNLFITSELHRITEISTSSFTPLLIPYSPSNFNYASCNAKALSNITLATIIECQ